MEGYQGENVIDKGSGTIYLKRNGQNIHILRAKEITASVSKNKSEIRFMGNRMVGHKSHSASGTGTLILYRATSDLDQDLLDYIKNNNDLYYSLQVNTEDPSTKFGRESKVLYGVNFDEIPILNLSNDDDVIEQEMAFTFEDWDILKPFDRPIPNEM